MSEAFAVQLQGDFLIPSQVAVVHRIKTYKNNLKLYQENVDPVLDILRYISMWSTKSHLDETRLCTLASNQGRRIQTLTRHSTGFFCQFSCDIALYIHAVLSIVTNRSTNPNVVHLTHVRCTWKQVSCWSAIDPTMQRRQLKNKKYCASHQHWSHHVIQHLRCSNFHIWSRAAEKLASKSQYVPVLA